MADTSEVRADIERTRVRMSAALTELERKVDVRQKVMDNPLPALALAFGAGIGLSASKADVKTAKAAMTAAQATGTKLGTGLDEVVSAVLAGVTAAFHRRLEAALAEVLTSLKGKTDPADGPSASVGFEKSQSPETPDALR